jgi:hypothetical protein
MFPLSKNGYTYSFLETGLQATLPDSREINLSFDSKLKLRHSSWTGMLSVRGPGGSVPLSPLSAEEQRAFLSEFFRRWKMRHPEEAKKAAFDYADAQKGFVGVAFVACVFFSLPLAAGLLADSRKQFFCTTVLQKDSVVGQMDVTSFKRKRKGHYILELAFTAPNGTVITGNDQVITSDETSIPKSVPVVYSPENPQCWSLTPNLAGTEVNWAKRRYFGTFTGMFGLFFLAVSLYGISWSILRWVRKRPFREEIAAQFSL